MDRVYTLTLTDTKNYGALLQAFALKEYISSLGVECQVINYHNPAMKYSQVKGWRKIRSVIWRNTFAGIVSNGARKSNTAEFKKRYLDHDVDNICLSEGLPALNSSADAFVVGSDQVWNPTVNANDNAFLLNFTEKKKIAYAASFGTNCVPKQYLIDNKEQFQSFAAISMREDSGTELLNETLGLPAETVLDPVFLLNKEEWTSSLHISENKPEKYVLCYVMPGDGEVVNKIIELAKSIAGEIKCKVVVLGEKDYKLSNDSVIYDHSCGPIEFLEYVSEAETIVTNSFHGTAFSIIFRKNFFTVMKKETFGRNTRIDNLLGHIGLDYRKSYIDDTIDKMHLTDSVDYTDAESKLSEYIAYSKEYLSNALFS